MANVAATLWPRQAIVQGATGAVPDLISGTAFPVPVLQFDPATNWIAYFPLDVSQYASGNPTFNVIWYSAAQTTNAVKWQCKIAAYTAGTDTGAYTSKALASAQTVTTTVTSNTGALNTSIITITNLDSVAAGDIVMLELTRLASDAADTMSGNATLVAVVPTYSNT